MISGHPDLRNRKRDSTGVVSIHHDVIRYCSIYPRRLVSPFRHLDRSRHPSPTPEQNSWLISRCATIIWEVLNLSLECVYVYAYDSCGGRLKTRFDVFAAVIPPWTENSPSRLPYLQIPPESSTYRMLGDAVDVQRKIYERR
jgi:hypothetical protein